ncbi:sugar ABC transporter substrate-binding protein [Geodermatophilus sp. URMC 62]|uniref:sugar ABC transporter substrate-binding protein n=1 Tax=Geodermatophilus sp. URMC 62 TaxID=3423414 RepID=UPI00406C30F3
MTKAPTEFPITEPLAELPPPGTTAAFLDNGTPSPAKVYEQLRQAGEVLGIEVQRVQTGRSPQEINAAVNTLVESRPDIVIDLAIDPAPFTPQREALQEQGAVFSPEFTVIGEQFGFDDSQISVRAAGARDSGRILASAVLAETNGEATELAYYRVPELPFTPLILEGVEERLAEQCPDCELRVVDISITEVGSTAPRTVVSDLQANPETGAFIVAVDELQIGLPAAMDVAGLDVPGMGTAPIEVNLQQIGDGQPLGAPASDPGMLAWMAMDQVLRTLAGQQYDCNEYYTTSHPGLFHVITDDSVPADIEAGYMAFDDYEEQFTKLWTGQ